MHLSGGRKIRNEGPVIFIKLYGMGSLIRLQQVVDQYDLKQEEFYLVTLPGLKPAADWLGWNTIDFSASHAWQLPGAFLKAVSQIKSLKPRAIVDLERASNGVGLLRLFSRNGAREISFRVDARETSNSSSREISLYQKPVTLALREALEDLGFVAGELTYEVEVESQPNLLVNLNASDYLPERKYPENQYLELVRLWSKKYPDSRILFTGSHGEKEFVQSVVDQLKGSKVENKAGSWTLNQFAQELAAGSLLITNDSGPMHLAHYLGTPTVVLWGPTHPEYVGYPDSDRLKNIWMEKSCSPCFEHPRSRIAESCQGRVDCLKEISPELIMLEAEKLWKPGVSRRVRLPQFHEVQKEVSA
ncbi:glycosyltransferase family 9 protein [bacterium SCSIO 12741]|nr:glycosyltransferase family 9 protein [bacterium SCSIO 12741]